MLCCARVRCARAASLLLLHVNLLLMLFSGAGLATAARLKWDPSLYVPVREAAPLEYRVLCALLPAGALALLLLAHAAVAVLAAGPRSKARRPVLYTYACVLALLTLMQCCVGAWAGLRAAAWLRSEQAHELTELLRARDHLRAALRILAKWLPLPDRVNDLIDEVEADLPRNGYAACSAVLALLVLQPAGVVLALLAARAPTPRVPRAPRASLSTLASTASAGAGSKTEARRIRQKNHSEASSISEKAPLRTAYKNGRLVIV